MTDLSWCSGLSTTTEALTRLAPAPVDRLDGAPAVPRAVGAVRAVASSEQLRLASVRFVEGRVDEALEQTAGVLATPQLPMSLYSSARVAELHALMARDDWEGARRAAQ